ncbi:TetR/AcrR family transcriptional regulator [Rhodococcus sp. TAF43]|uniref:TetR/AcrR family transcriptional regulator n=1 Tax=unclassified Rhodococcus (in: high G+C Gram-positive bacteria) TaxID=192944 RepID=UPI0015820E74|nr:TetR/AcrR family transcriptional regulator [Rhodococcus sp. W8901]QKT10268.1 TetR/AcrR family transcriptional regulator [Rhodococcus sp. W8901]
MPYVSVEQRRRDLIDAAIRVTADVGLAAASTRAICAEAGVQQSVFHYCFSSKEELLRELTREVVAGMVETAVATLPPGVDVRESIHKGLYGLWRMVSVQPEKQLVFYELTVGALREPNRSDIPEWQYREYYASTGTFLERLAETAEIEWTVPIPVLSRMVTTAIDGLILGWLADRRADEVEASLEAFAEMFAGLAVRPVVVA